VAEPSDAANPRQTVVAGDSETGGEVPLASGEATVPGQPTRIARFRVRRRLGAGAFGDVYLAHDPQLDRDIALKVPQSGTLDSPRRVERFLREARSAARLRHPHIVPVYDAGQDGDTFYIAAAFIEGRTLADAIGEGGIDLRRAAELVRDLAEALAYAHELGIVHSDVKPANVMLDQNGEPHLMDFGLAYRLGVGGQAGPEEELAGEDRDAQMTRRGAILGTPAYMAPEQAAGRAEQVLAASDQYSLGVVLYELVCGRVPFSGPPQVVRFNHIRTPPPVPASLRPDLPLDLEMICLKALAKRLEERYASCQELADDLRRCLEGESVRVRPRGVVERVVPWCLREPALAMLGGMVAFCLLVVALVSCWSARRQAELRAEGDGARVQAEENWQRAEHQKALADEAREGAEAGLRREEEQRRKAEQAEKLAEAAGLRAEQARQKEAGERQLKEAALEETQTTLYFRLTALAERELRDNNPARAKERLDGCEPFRRGWEWDYLNHRSSLQLRAAADVSPVNALAFHPNAVDRRLALARQGKTLKVWNPVGRGAVDDYEGHAAEVLCVAFGPDGSMLASGDRDGGVLVWDLGKRQQPRSRLQGHKAPVCCVAFSPDGSRLASGSVDGLVKLWDFASGKPLRTLGDEGAAVRQVAFNPNKQLGQIVCAAYQDNVVRVWKIDETTAKEEAETLRGYTSGAFRSDGLRFALAREDGVVRITDILTKAKVFELEGNRGEVQAVSFSNSRAGRLATGDSRTARVWDMEKGMALRTFPGVAFAFSPDGERVATLGEGGAVRIWYVANGKSIAYAPAAAQQETLTLAGYGEYVLALAYSPDGKQLATAAAIYDTDRLLTGEVKLWDRDSGQEAVPFREQHAEVYTLAYSPDRKLLAAAGKDGVVRLWDSQNAREVAWFRHPATEVWHLAFDPDGKRLACACRDGKIHVWDWNGATAREAYTCDGGTQPVTAVAFGPGGKLLAAGSEDRKVRTWDAASGMRLGTVGEHARAVRALAISPDGARLAAGSDDPTVMIWELATGRPIQTLKGHTRAVVGVAFSPDGKRLASAGVDMTVRVWDTQTYQEALALRGETRFTSVAFSPDGRQLAAGSADGIKVWDAPASR
jgi:WD40 repeat protein